VNRAVWDMRYLPPNILANPIPITPEMEAFGFNPNPQGYLVMPGKYSVSMSLKVNGVVTDLKQTQSFNVITEGKEKMTDAERVELAAFQKKVGALQRAVSGSIEVGNATKARINSLRRSANEAPVADNSSLVNQANGYLKEIDLILNELRGGRENSDIPPPSIASRVGNIAGTIRLSTTKPTKTQIEQYELSNTEFKPVLARLKKLVEVDLPAYERQLESVGAPLTVGRLPEFQE
jgi:hypothetical protein